MHICTHMCIHIYRETCKIFCHHPFYEGTLGNNQLPISSVLMNIKKNVCLWKSSPRDMLELGFHTMVERQREDNEFDQARCFANN